MDLDYIRERFLGIHPFAAATPLGDEMPMCIYCPAPALEHPTDGLGLPFTPQQQIIADLVEEVERLRRSSNQPLIASRELER